MEACPNCGRAWDSLAKKIGQCLRCGWVYRESK